MPLSQSFAELPVRLLTYNIHKGIGGRDRLYRLERIKQVIAAENPDIVCLQEVDRNVRRSRFDNQPVLLTEWFASAAHMYQFNVKVRDGGYGNLLMSAVAVQVSPSDFNYPASEEASRCPTGGDRNPRRTTASDTLAPGPGRA